MHHFNSIINRSHVLIFYQVSVDYYVTSRIDTGNFDGVLHEKLQKEGIIQRWKMSGMKPDDVAIISDLDETFTRDFLRALQVCDIPEFRVGQSCHSPKLLGSTLVLESSPECITKERRWYHPGEKVYSCYNDFSNCIVF